MTQREQSLCDALDAVMADKAVTNISGWTEQNNDTQCDGDAYRRRLGSNTEIINKKIEEALSFV